MEEKNNLSTNIETENRQESKKQLASFNINKTLLLIIILLFMFYSKFWDIAWDIGKSLLYIIIIIYLISFLNQGLADNIKNVIHDFININSNNNFITDMFGKLLTQLKNWINIQPDNFDKLTSNISEKNISNEDIQSHEKLHVSIYDGGNSLSDDNTKNLSNSKKSYSKNIFA
jgi:hypothetical protein